jgi:hypothetical protein
MSVISSGTTLTTALVQTGDTNGNLVFKTGASGTTALTLGSDQSATFAGAVSFGSSAFGLGSAGAPSITFTGDTNTGIFSPGADTIAFTEGGVESMRLNSSGNLGIGTASPALGLVVEKDNGSGYVAGFRNASGSPILTIQNTGGVSQIQGLNSALSATANIAMQLSGGNVGIGTSSPAARLDIGDGTGSVSTRINGGTGTTQGSFFAIAQGGTSNGAFGNWSSIIGGSFDSATLLWSANELRFVTGGGANERMRITSTGNVGIGTSSPSAKLTVVDGGSTFVSIDANGYARITQSSGSAQLGLFRSGTSVGGGYIGGDGTNCFDVRDSAFTSRFQVAQNGQLLGVIAGTSTMRSLYPCQAWVNFNGTGTPAIRGSGNISSITKSATGYFRCNFGTAMPDLNFTVLVSANASTNSGGYHIGSGGGNDSTSYANAWGGWTNGPTDLAWMGVAVFR